MMFSLTLTGFVLLGVGIFTPIFGRNRARSDNIHDIPFPIELLPENEYLIGATTPVYLLRTKSDKLKVHTDIINNVFDAEQKFKFLNIYIDLLNLVPQDNQRIFLSRPDIPNQNNTIRPEILVIIDYDLYSRFQQKWKYIIPYVIAFWNAVDLKFRTLHSPSYRLNIAEIIVAGTPDALSYINRFKYSMKGVNFVSAAPLLDASADWLYKYQRTFPLSDYDIAVTMTSNILCRQLECGRKKISCKEQIFGITFQAQACHDDFLYKKTYKTAIIYNAGAYDRVLAAANTISLLMSTSNSPRYNDRNRCIIADVPKIITSSDWTHAQINSLQNFIKDVDKSYCLKSVPEHGEKIQTFLPGMTMDANEQCRRMGFAMAAKIDASICRQLECIRFNRLTNYCISETEAADGTTCGTNKICLHSECISIGDENEIISMY